MPATAPASPNDLGVILYASQDGSGSYVTPKGTTVSAKTLTSANYITSSTINCGGFSALALTVTGTISVAMASAVVIVERRRVDPNNTSIPKWSVIGTVRSDAPGSSPAASQTILRADLVGQSVDEGSGAAAEVLGVTLLTTDHVLASELRVIVVASNAPQAGDKIIISANAGGA